MKPGYEQSGAQQPNAKDDAAMDQALLWFARLREKTPDPQTLDAFARWQSDNLRHSWAYQSLEKLWGSAEPAVGTESLPGWRLGRPDWQVGKKTRRLPLALGALAAAVLIGLGVCLTPSLLVRWNADYQTPAGSQERVRLPDGSTMILNTDTAVSINFSNGYRHVSVLKGEAFFEVAQNSRTVFEVTGAFGGVTATGTAFAVKTDGHQDDVVLEQGRVAVRDLEAPQRRAILSEGETVTAQDTGLSFVGSIDAKRALAWRDGHAVFSNQPLSEVIADLARYRRAPVFLFNEAIARKEVSGDYRLDDVDEAIRIVADASGAKMTRLPGGMLILR